MTIIKLLLLLHYYSNLSEIQKKKNKQILQTGKRKTE